MKPLFTRTLTLLTLVLSIVISAGAQNSNGLRVVFNGSASDTKSAIQSNTLSFQVSGLNTDQQVQDFIKRSQVYSKGFTMTVVPAADKNFQQCKITFNGTPEAKWLQRFFMSSGIEQVELNGEKKNVNDFFKSIQ
jgi:hypothetical protein